MAQLDWRILLAIALAAVLAFAYLSRAIGGWKRSAIAKRRSARAMRGEAAAEELLERAGYEILARQESLYWELECDGEAHEFLLRADLIVTRDGEEYVAEVKTGEHAPSLTNAATRRQLLEYSLAFDSPVILLVDVERDEILEVAFPLGPLSSAAGRASS